MHPADKAVLRLAVGMGLAVLVAYGMALPLPFAVCVMAVLALCKPGPPDPFVKGVVTAIIVAALLVAGVLMVPMLENYAFTGLMLTAVLLYGVFFKGALSASPLTTILVIAITLVPVAGVVEQALAPVLAVTLAVGLLTGTVVSSVSHALFPDPPAVAGNALAPPEPVSRASASWTAARATLVVMPVFVLALTNPAFYLAAVMKSVTLGQQACSTSARTAGRELVGSTLMGAAMAAMVWMGLSLRPNLWMLMLWIVAAAMWAGARLFRVRRTSLTPSFWVNALITMFILLGPAIEDSASGKDVFTASLGRVALFVVIALYAWATVWVLEKARAWRSRPREIRAPGSKAEQLLTDKPGN
ncbi:DUF2955 domain-containing protein [Variovorax sp. J22R133]|uniref:DUF2955 domain-containing protein n=1 Tax=Variovorax brevis TaxID=3053503 RepID=UPI002578D757|nr:DUF2955 domain-containing protein [Variovorax sp. J22R133]MDM0111253.1 DUF2955 domain-containing protein [Variovorax sp. J22R133]